MSNSTNIEHIQIAHSLRAKPGRLISLGRLAKKKPLGTVSLLLIVILVLSALFAEALAPHDPIEIFYGHKLEAPNSRFILGTDQTGRDILSRIIYGSRVSLYVGLVSTILGTLGGSVLGIISGYLEGRVDMIMQRVMDGIQAFPGLILALSIVSVLGPSMNNAMLAIAIVLIPSANRVVRGAVMTVKQNQYVDAARALGASDLRMLVKHITPNVTAPIIVLASISLGNQIIIEASLSFLGLGTQPPTPSWGGMLSGGGRTYFEQAPWLAIFPGVAISLAVLGFNLLGDALRDVWDPRMRGT